MTNSNAEINIYVACSAAYNNGKLHGCWIDATQELDEIQDQINSMLASSPEEDAEDDAIHDYEGFGSYSLGEYEGIDSAQEVVCFIEEHGELGAELLGYYSDIEDERKAVDESYCGCHTSVADYAQKQPLRLVLSQGSK